MQYTNIQPKHFTVKSNRFSSNTNYYFVSQRIQVTAQQTMTHYAEPLYQSINKPRTEPDYVDQEESIILHDETESLHGIATENQAQLVRVRQRESDDYATFAREIHPPSLFGNSPPLTGAHKVENVYNYYVTPQASMAASPSALFDAQSQQMASYVQVVPNTTETPVLLPVYQVQPMSMPMTYSPSPRSAYGSKIDIISRKPGADYAGDDSGGGGFAQCNRGCYVFCLILVIVCLIGAVVAAGVVQVI